MVEPILGRTFVEADQTPLPDDVTERPPLPVVLSHGYWVRDLARVEPRFGTEATLEALADDLHARDMKLLLAYELPFAAALLVAAFQQRTIDGETMQASNAQFLQLAEKTLAARETAAAARCDSRRAFTSTNTRVWPCQAIRSISPPASRTFRASTRYPRASRCRPANSSAHFPRAGEDLMTTPVPTAARRAPAQTSADDADTAPSVQAPRGAPEWGSPCSVQIRTAETVVPAEP